MEVRRKLAILADAAKYDASCASSGVRRRGAPGKLGSATGVGICHSYTPDGRCISLLKILLTNFCIYDCQFCVNRISADVPRARFRVEEVVRLTLDFYRRNYIEGLFLSSGIWKSPDATMSELARVAKSLRQEHGFRGYIHLKAVPGASCELIEEAGLWCDRLSANIELPTQGDLDRLAPEKTIAAAEGTMAEISTLRRAAKAERRTAAKRSGTKAKAKPPAFAPAGQSTQMVVGATESDDRTLLDTSSRLYRSHGLKRVYYTAYSPIPKADPRLPPEPPPLVREHRLYQADWLVRFYGFEAPELTTADDPHLRLDLDPKLAWALRNRDLFPVDVNRAPRETLLRVPGFGVRSVNRILSIRRHRRLRLEDLAKLRLPIARARAFVVTADHNPALALLDRGDLERRLTPPAAREPAARQLPLFGARGEAGAPLLRQAAASALTGEL